MRTRPINFGHFYPKCKFTAQNRAQNLKAWFSGFSTFRQLTLDMGVLIRSMGSPDCEDIKIAFGGFGTWMTFKKPEMDKTLKNGLSMNETDSLNHK